mgnify:CR=1 FL=1
MSQFSKSLRDIRKKSGKKQREAAEYLGLNIRTYQYYEFSDPELQSLFDRLEDAACFTAALQEQASFFTGVYLGWRLSRALGS